MSNRVLLVHNSPAVRSVVRNALYGRYTLVEASIPAMAPRIVRGAPVHVVILGCAGVPSQDALDLVGEIRDAQAGVPVILVASDASAELAIAALRAGVNDYLPLPLQPAALLDAVGRLTASGTRGSIPGSNGSASAKGSGRELVGVSSALRELRSYLLKVARSECNVLVTGETGTGKEVVVRLLHQASPRAARPLVCLNCAAVPDLLLESELFGYERGAFTGATSSKDGKAQLADGGTLLLDEIGEMSLCAQAKILRMIESREIQRLGARAPIPVDVRIVAATNEELEEKVRQRAFRADLYFRLNVARIHLPPLRDRKEDLGPLIGHFVTELNQRCRLEVRGCTEGALDVLRRHDWPGNVRELRNVLEAAFINQPATIDVEHLPPTLATASGGDSGNGNGNGDSVERERLLAALSQAHGNKSVAAKTLHCSRMTLYRRLERFGLAGPSSS
jgi:DNA-binding NtrC family response regulator